MQPIKRAVVCPPTHFRIIEPINPVEAMVLESGIKVDSNRAMEEHRTFVDTLKAEGVDVITMQPSPGLPEQVFIRDVGIGLKEKLLLGHMRKEIRRNEVDAAQRFLEGKVKIAGRVNDGFLEGGDYVLLPDGTACCGIGRSNVEGVTILEKHLKRPVIKIPVKEAFVHFSGLISVVGDHVCVACLEALPKWFAEFLMKKFDVIEVGLEEEERLLYSACNVLSLDGEKVISFPQNCRVNEELKRRGFDVLEVEISEILKGGGGFTCLVLLLNQNAF